MSAPLHPHWVDGTLVAAAPPRSAAPAEIACYTTARVSAGRAHLGRRHARRLRRDAARVGIGGIDEELVLRALAELAEAAFGGGEGIVRVEARRGEGGRPRLVGVPRPLGPDEPEWLALRAPVQHPGATRHAGCKLVGNPAYARARQAARAARVHESLLFDAAEHLVEGARSNLLVHTEAGELLTPAREWGPVAGIARELVLERVPEAREGDVSSRELGAAREIIAVNAVRGARAIVRLDGAPVGEGRPGPWAKRLAAVLAAD